MDEVLRNYVLEKLAETPAIVEKKLWNGRWRPEHSTYGTSETWPTETGQKLKPRYFYFDVKNRVNEFLSTRTKNRLVVMTGLRRTGKTTSLLQLYDYLVNERKIEQNRVFYFSADELVKFLKKNIFETVKTFVEEIHQATIATVNKKLVILIDEAHYDKEWSAAAKIIFDQTTEIFVVFTGSSALEIELSQDTANRAIKQRVYPLSFSEYLEFKYNVEKLQQTREALKQVLLNSTEKNFTDFTAMEQEFNAKYLAIRKPIEIEFKQYLTYQALPTALAQSREETYEKIESMIDRIIENDVFTIQSFNTETKYQITKIISFLALQSPGGISHEKLSQILEKTSASQVSNILDVLEKAQLLFSVKPYVRSATKVVKSPWKYYFATPNIPAALRKKLAGDDVSSSETLGILVENLVAAQLKQLYPSLSIYYDPESEGVDFLIQKANEIIPIEVGLHKDSRQIQKAIKKYKSPYGIVISNYPKTTKNNNEIHMPITTFALA